MNYKMGFKIDGTAIPDPNAFSGAESDIDTLGTRASSGNLRRNMIATKYHQKMEYTGITWQTMVDICSLMHKNEKFKFTYPEPFLGKTQTITAYVGDREWEATKCVGSQSDWIGTLKFSIIEY